MTLFKCDFGKIQCFLSRILSWESAGGIKSKNDDTIGRHYIMVMKSASLTWPCYGWPHPVPARVRTAAPQNLQRPGDDLQNGRRQWVIAITGDRHPMQPQYWASVSDVDPALSQHWASISSYLEWRLGKPFTSQITNISLSFFVDVKPLTQREALLGLFIKSLKEDNTSVVYWKPC